MVSHRQRRFDVTARSPRISTTPLRRNASSGFGCTTCIWLSAPPWPSASWWCRAWTASCSPRPGGHRPRYTGEVAPAIRKPRRADTLPSSFEMLQAHAHTTVLSDDFPVESPGPPATCELSHWPLARASCLTCPPGVLPDPRPAPTLKPAPRSLPYRLCPGAEATGTLSFAADRAPDCPPKGVAVADGVWNAEKPMKPVPAAACSRP